MPVKYKETVRIKFKMHNFIDETTMKKEDMSDAYVIKSNISKKYEKIVKNNYYGALLFGRADNKELNLSGIDRDKIFAEALKQGFKSYWNLISMKPIYDGKFEAIIDVKIDCACIDNKFYVAIKKITSSKLIAGNLKNKRAKTIVEIENQQVLAQIQEKVNERFYLAMAEMKKNYAVENFVENVFEALNILKYSVVDGIDAGVMFEIYKNAKLHFPIFKKMSAEKQIMTLKNAYTAGRKGTSKIQRRYDLAQAIFYEFANKGLIDEVITVNPNTGEKRVLFKLKEHRYANNQYIRFVDFKYQNVLGVWFRISMLSADLCDLFNNSPFREE